MQSLMQHISRWFRRSNIKEFGVYDIKIDLYTLGSRKKFPSADYYWLFFWKKYFSWEESFYPYLISVTIDGNFWYIIKLDPIIKKIEHKDPKVCRYIIDEPAMKEVLKEKINKIKN